MSPQMLYLPGTMADWPWQRHINPLYDEVTAEANAWFFSFVAFDPPSQDAFDKCDFGRLASLGYPRASKGEIPLCRAMNAKLTLHSEHLRTGIDLMNLFFLIEEYTDGENANVTREMVDTVIDALNNPHKPRPDGEIPLGGVAKQFWSLAIKTASPSSQRHFIESFTAYLESVVDQADDRDNDTIRTIESYLKNRRENIGARPTYVPLELGLDLPDEAFFHPVVVELSYNIADLIILDNVSLFLLRKDIAGEVIALLHDIASYNREQSVGDDRHNILTIAMHQFHTDFDGAMAWVLKYHKEVEAKFLAGMQRVPSFGSKIDKQLEEYIQGLANWPRCNDCWNFESGRYFGTKGLEYQKTRYVPLLSKKTNGPTITSVRAQRVVPLVSAY